MGVTDDYLRHNKGNSSSNRQPCTYQDGVPYISDPTDRVVAREYGVVGPFCGGADRVDWVDISGGVVEDVFLEDRRKFIMDRLGNDG